MSLIKVIRLDNKGIVRELTRLNDNLELLLTQGMGLHLKPPSLERDASDISYTDDVGTLRQELVDIHDGRNPLRPIEDEDV